MPVPILGSKVRSDTLKVKFLTIFGRPKTGFFHGFRGVPGRAPLATNHAVKTFEAIGSGLAKGGGEGLGRVLARVSSQYRLCIVLISGMSSRRNLPWGVSWGKSCVVGS